MFLGDSNLSLIPRFKDSNIQVDSFPEANMDHLFELLKKREPDHTVTKVVLSVGLINCINLNQEITLKKCFTRLMKQAELTFPCAPVYFPLINIHSNFSRAQQVAVNQLNDLAIRKGNYLTEVNQLFFEPEEDGVHWSPSTAHALFEHWMEQLDI